MGGLRGPGVLTSIGMSCALACALALVQGCEQIDGWSSTPGSGGQGNATGGGGQSGGGGGASHTNPLSQDLIDAFVAAHNQARSSPLDPPPSPSLPPVTWDAVLADVAFNYTSRCEGSGGLVNHN